VRSIKLGLRRFHEREFDMAITVAQKAQILADHRGRGYNPRLASPSGEILLTWRRLSQTGAALLRKRV